MNNEFCFLVPRDPDSVRQRLAEQIAPEGTRLDSSDRLGRYRRGHAMDGDAIEIVRYAYSGRYGSGRYAPRTWIVAISAVTGGSQVTARLKPNPAASTAGKVVLFLIFCLPLGLLGVAYAASSSDVQRNVGRSLPVLVIGCLAIAGLFATLPAVVKRANVHLERDFLRHWLGVPGAKPPVLGEQARVMRDSLLYLAIYFTTAVFLAGLVAAISKPQHYSHH